MPGTQSQAKAASTQPLGTIKNKKGHHPNTPPLWEESRAQHCQAKRYSWAMKNMSISIRPDEIGNFILQQSEQYDQEVKVSKVGTVLQVEDGIARITGLGQVMAGELIEFEDGTVGIAQDLEENNVGVVLMGEGHDIQEGSPVTATGKIAQVPVEGSQP